MKKRLFLFTVFAFFMLNVINLSAQVTIGSDQTPLSGALLDLKEKSSSNAETSTNKGFVLPRIKLTSLTTLSPITKGSGETDAHYAGLTVFNTNNSSPFSKGIYTWDGERWSKAGVRKEVNFFYMPSIELTTSSAISYGPIDIYEKYTQIFGTPKVRGGGPTGNTPASIPVFGRNDLYYYITNYDESVFSDMTLTENGELSYTVSNPPTDGCSYINIVFVIK